MHDDYLTRPKQLLRDDDAPQRIACSAASILDNVGVVFFKAEGASSV
jgi:hypothetical protein